MNKKEKILITGCLLITVLCALASIGLKNAKAEVFTIQVHSIYDQTETGFTTLLYATCLDSTNTTHLDNITFTINGAAFTYNDYTNRYEAVYTRNTPGTEIFGALGAFADSENITSTATVTLNTTVIWTEGTIERLQTDFMTGDWINAILGEYTFSMGALFFWTAVMVIISGGIYNVGGAYVTLFAWILGWGVFSSVIHGQAQIVGYFFIVLGAGLALVKLALDRRTS